MAAASASTLLQANLEQGKKFSARVTSKTICTSSRNWIRHCVHHSYSPHQTLYSHSRSGSGIKNGFCGPLRPSFSGEVDLVINPLPGFYFGCGLRNPNGMGFKGTRSGFVPGRFWPNSYSIKGLAASNRHFYLNSYPLNLASKAREVHAMQHTFPNGNTVLKLKHHVCRGKALAAIDESVCHPQHKESGGSADQDVGSSILQGWTPPRYVWRALAAWVIAGQVIARVLKGKIHSRNVFQQLEVVGPGSTGVCLLTAAFVGMAFTIQFVREFTRLGLTRSVGGVLALAFSRELSPVVTAIIIAGRVGSAFAAELGTMQVSEQTDTLRVLGTDPVDYLIIPRVLACCLALPILTLICFSVSIAASVLLADGVYNVSANIILESARRSLDPWDIISAMVKSTVFGGLISVISCAWGVTTLGGAKGVGESTTSAVVISLVCIFVADFVLSWCFFQGAGDALKAAMG